MSLGDKIKFKNKEGKLVNSVILRYETNYDEITFESPSIINASVDYELPETPEIIAKKAMIKVDQATGEILSQVEDVREDINGDNGLLQRVNVVENKQTATDLTINIISKNIDKTNGEIREITTTNGYTFNSDGMHISSSDNEFNAIHNSKGAYYRDGNTVLTQFTKDNTIIKDLVLYGKYYYGVNEYLDVANFTKDDAMFIAEKYTDNNGEVGFGHFYNGGE